MARCYSATGCFSDEVYDSLEQLKGRSRQYFVRRIELFERALLLKDGGGGGGAAAVAQVRAVLDALGCTYRDLYGPIFNQQRISDDQGYTAFDEYARAKQQVLDQRIEPFVQSSTNLESM